jgi:Sec7-like guanine-nucleotide exchange factor
LAAFADRYVDQNREGCSPDAVCILASAILLLNTDLHSPVRLRTVYFGRYTPAAFATL